MSNRRNSNYWKTLVKAANNPAIQHMVKSGYKRLSNYASSSNKRQKVPSNYGKKKTPAFRTNVNMLAHRTAIKTKGRKSIKSIVHGKKKVKVSPKLRKKIKKVMNGEKQKGMYHTTRFGTIGITTTDNDGFANQRPISVSMGGYTLDQLAFIAHARDTSGNQRWWFQQALQQVGTDSSGIGSGDASLDQGSEWQFFSPLKILDAASVLWNQKTIDRNYVTQTDNLNTVVQAADGAPVVGTNVVPGIKGLKVQINNSYVKFTIKNNSQRLMKVCVYKCVPKIKFPTSLSLNDFRDSIVREADAADLGYISAVSPGFTATEDAQALFINPAFEPKYCKAFAASWKYEKQIVRLSPGETITTSVQGPKNYELDYRKLFDGSTDEQGKAFKGTTCCVMMSVEADLVFTTANIGTAAARQGITGHYVQGVQAADSLSNPISIMWEEVYRLSMPDIVGFTQRAVSAGDPHNLNLRIPRMAFGNFTQLNTTGDATDPTYTGPDTQQPGTDIGPYENPMHIP